jgi:hypothetical protein
MKALVVLFALAATAHADSFAAPKLYAAMFEKGHHWTFDIKTKGKGAAVMTCEVADVKTYANGVASKITCDRKLDSDYSIGPAGVWAATAKGLSSQRDEEFPDKIDDDLVMIAARPRASKKRTKDDEGGYSVEKVFAKGTQWCKSFDAMHAGAGDAEITTSCFKPDVGLAWGELDIRSGPSDPRDIVYTARD